MSRIRCLPLDCTALRVAGWGVDCCLGEGCETWGVMSMAWGDEPMEMEGQGEYTSRISGFAGEPAELLIRGRVEGVGVGAVLPA